jgi:two-component system, chemotaxis family, chemotaxis protein CheY
MARVLVVEDEPEVQTTLCDLLAQGGHEPISASTGQAAMQDVRNLSYDLLVTDIVMREVDGWQIIRWLRANRPAVPVIAISGGARALHPETALNLSKAYGAHRVLTKPVSGHDLLQTVSELLHS